jgi:hypothetical protein
MTNRLAEWYEQNRSRLEARGVRLVFERSPEDGRGKRSAWLIAQDDEKGGQITVWDTGECQLIRPDCASSVEELVLVQADDLLAAVGRLEAVFDK